LLNGSEKAPNKISTLYVLSNGKLIDSAQLKRAEIKLDHSQEIQTPTNQQAAKDSDFVAPPYNLQNLAILYEKNTAHYRAVKAKAEDSVGLGWTIVDKKGTANENRRQELIDLLNNINPMQTLDEVLNNAMVDFESIGGGYLEIARDNASQKITLLNHIPSVTILISKDMKRYLHQRGNQKTYFKRFGDEDVLNPKIGKFEPSLPKAEGANELWPFVHYFPRSDFYGIPDVIPAMGAVLGDVFSRDYNLDFFQNGAIPAYAVIVEGADVTEEVKKAIEDFFKHDLKGGGNQHRTIVIPAPGDNVKVRFEALNVNIKDGSFKLYRQDNKEEILSAHGVPPSRAFHFKLGTLGGDVSKASAKIYEETTITRNRKMVQRAMNAIIAGMGFPEFSFKLNRSQNTDLSQLGSFISSVATSRTLTPNEQREILSPLFENGLDNVPGGDEIWLDIAGVPTRLVEIFPEDGKAHLDQSRPGFKGLAPGRRVIDYDEVDFELAEQYNNEYSNTKAGESLEQLRKQAKAVGELKTELIFVFDKMIKAAFNALEKQGSPIKRFLGFQEKAGGVRVNPVLMAVEKLEDEMVAVIRASLEKTLPQGAKFGADKLGIGFVRGDKAIVRLQEPDVALSFALNDPEVVAFLDSQAAAVGKSLTLSLSGQLRNQMKKGIDKGETNKQIAERLKKTVGFHGVHDSRGRLITKQTRALMIARTEVATGFNVGAVNTYRKSQMVKTVSVFDGNDFDDACSSANGQKWTLARAENNPLEHPNCTRAFAPNVEG